MAPQSRQESKSSSNLRGSSESSSRLGLGPKLRAKQLMRERRYERNLLEEKSRAYFPVKCDPWESRCIQFIFHDVGDSKQTHFFHSSYLPRWVIVNGINLVWRLGALDSSSTRGLDESLRCIIMLQ